MSLENLENTAFFDNNATVSMLSFETCLVPRGVPDMKAISTQTKRTEAIDPH